MTPRCAIIAFPGNNCETETARAARRNGFDAQVLRWNQIDLIGEFDVYILPGGFSFEDRGRSGAIAAREPIFDKLREEAQKGKLILGICNGAQMIVESGLIPINKNSLPFALAHNIRRDQSGHVLGTGFYNEWCYLKPERTDTAFTQNIETILHIPFAHGEGRFTSKDEAGISALETGSHVAFRYCNENGDVSDLYPTTPNGALSATAAITNKEGTIMAIMPHPERFFESFDGDKIFQSMYDWVSQKKSPETVIIGNFSTLSEVKINNLKIEADTCILEKKLIITDNENFSVKEAAQRLTDENCQLTKSIRFEIHASNQLSKEDEVKIVESGLILNPNKELLIDTSEKMTSKFMVKDFQNDEANHLAEKLSELLGKELEVDIYKCWDFGSTNKESIEKILQNRLLSNQNASEIYQVS